MLRAIAVCTEKMLYAAHPRLRCKVTIPPECACCHCNDDRPNRKTFISSIFCAHKWIETSPVAYSMGLTVLVCTMYSVNVLAAKMTFMVFLRYIPSEFLLSLTHSHPRSLSLSLFGPFVSNAINTLCSNINDIGFRRTLNEFKHNVYLYWLSGHLVHFRLFSINVLNKSRY